MTTATPMIDAIFIRDAKLREGAREIYQKYDVTEMEAANLIALARQDAIDKMLLNIGKIQGRKRMEPLP